jgi:hypothetical protein
MTEEMAKILALAMSSLCVRNTSIETIHAGITPHSQAGDYSDTFVSTPAGSILWKDVSRITDAEMKAFMIEVVDGIYTVMLRMDDPEFMREFLQLGSRYAAGWDEPKISDAFKSI